MDLTTCSLKDDVLMIDDANDMVRDTINLSD